MPAKVTPEEFVEALEQWSVLDVVNAVKAIEEKFGIKAAAPVAVGGPAPAQTNGEAPVEEEEKTEFTLVLSGVGDSKINVIKAVRELTNLGLKEAKDLVDTAPKPVKEGVSKEEAETIRKKFADAGA